MGKIRPRVLVAILVAACGSSPTQPLSVQPQPTASPTVAPSPSARPTAEPTPSPTAIPTLTPRSSPGLSLGHWSKVPGRAQAPQTPQAALAGVDGVLLLEAGSPICTPPGDETSGSVAAFYDARTGAISRIASPRVWWGAGLAALADGRVLVAGGWKSSGSMRISGSTQIWDSNTRGWTDAAPMGTPRAFASLFTLGDGRVMAVGGEVPDTECDLCTHPTDATEIYDPAADSWTPASPPVLKLPDGSTSGSSDLVALGDTVLASGFFAASLYDPAADRWSPVVGWRGGRGITPLADGTMLSFGVEYFGEDGGVAVPLAMRFDPRGTTTTVARWGPAEGAAVALLPGDRVFAAGGLEIGDDVDDAVILGRVEAFEPSSGRVSELAPMPIARWQSVAVPLGDASVLLVGGLDTPEEDPEYSTCVPVDYRALRWVP